ncbi:hypothetical protein ACTUVN_002375 [Pseudomonas caspiana]
MDIALERNLWLIAFNTLGADGLRHFAIESLDVRRRPRRILIGEWFDERAMPPHIFALVVSAVCLSIYEPDEGENDGERSVDHKTFQRLHCRVLNQLIQVMPPDRLPKELLADRLASELGL